MKFSFVELAKILRKTKRTTQNIAVYLNLPRERVKNKDYLIIPRHSKLYKSIKLQEQYPYNQVYYSAQELANLQKVNRQTAVQRLLASNLPPDVIGFRNSRRIWYLCDLIKLIE